MYVPTPTHLEERGGPSHHRVYVQGPRDLTELNFAKELKSTPYQFWSYRYRRFLERDLLIECPSARKDVAVSRPLVDSEVAKSSLITI